MPLSFPSNPTTGQTSVQNGRTYVWNGSNAWELSNNTANHASTHGVSGADPVTIASSQVTGLASVATSGNAADLSAGTLADARLSGNVILAANLGAQQNGSASSLDVFSRFLTQTATAITGGTVTWTFFASPYSFTASQIAYGSGGAQSTQTLVRFGLYTVDSAGAVTLVARTASDTTVFSAGQTLYTRSFATTGGYPSTYAIVAGVRYAIAVIVVGSNGAISGMALNNAAINNTTPRITANLTGQTDLPTSVASNGYSTQGTLALWGRIS